MITCHGREIAAVVPAAAIKHAKPVSLLLVDSAPIIYTLEAEERLAARFAPMFQRHADGEPVLAVTTITIAEVLTDPLRAGKESLAIRYRVALDAWRVVDLTSDVAESAAWPRDPEMKQGKKSARE